ncbi:MAG: insulinase family protein [Parahaliea sp.]
MTSNSMSNHTAAIKAHPGFEAVRQVNIEALNLQVEEYRHRQTGAVHYHLASDSRENVFLVALRTVPMDSTGVAHILEHTALCGSERYPVRDPFFMMLRRSLNTFMNAFTSSDWTAYPFASQNRKDFDNLLQVYLDAVFFSRLDALDFAQEGHRLEFEETTNSDSALVYKGVVFNEMKGAMSSLSSTLWQTLCEQLFPSTSYHYNSGGDPEHIPDLSYGQLKQFYKSHYHPSNAIFMTFGDIAAAEHQAIFEERALQHFERQNLHIEVPLEQRLSAPLRVVRPYAFDESGSSDHKTHIVIGWLLGESSNLMQMLEAQLLASVLIDNSASPLMHALETTDLGQAPSPLCGLEESMREMVFCCGLEGSDTKHVDALETLVLRVISQLADEGIAHERLEAVLHQLELHQREISGDSFPYGLQLILQALGCATHYADPIGVLDLEPVIARLRSNIADPDYIKNLARSLLLDNPHRVTLVMQPDKNLSSQRAQKEAERLAAIKASMSEADKAQVIEHSAQLHARQQQVDDPTVLPRVELADVPATLPELNSISTSENGVHLTRYAQGTNGLVYQQVISELPGLDETQMQALPLYTNILTELGVKNTSYLATQQRQAASVGSISTFTSMRGDIDNEQNVRAYLVLSSKALARNAAAQTTLMLDTLSAPNFSERSRIQELISQQRARREQAITGNGHGLAMAAACAGMSPLARLNHQLSGMEGIRSLRALDQRLKEADTLDDFAESLNTLHQKLISTPRQLLTIADEQQVATVASQTLTAWQEGPTGNSAAHFALPPVREQIRQMWVTNTQVNFCAKAYPTVAVGHPDAAALVVLGGFLRNGHLHRAIREQGGAYGGGATQDNSIAAFRFYSYRDPRLEATLADFDTALPWLLDNRHDERSLEEAILGVISSMDKPSSPAGEAKQHFHNALFGRTHDQRVEFRERILAVSMDDLRRVAVHYLQPETASVAVITSASQAGASTALGLERLEL